MIGPGLQVFGKHLRSILDVMLDGHGIVTQSLYLAVFLVVLSGSGFFIFLHVSGCRLKFSSLFASLEFGPPPQNQLQITEEIKQEMAKSIDLAFAKQK